MVETLTREINTLTEEVGSVGIARREAVRLKEFDSWEVKFGLREKRVEEEKNLMTRQVKNSVRTSKPFIGKRS